MAKKKANGKAKVRPAAKPRRRNGINVTKFVEVYSTTFNATEAARAAGSTAKDLSHAGWEILRKPQVMVELQKLNAVAAEHAGLSIERTLREVARLSYSDIRKLYNENGTLKLPHEWDDDTAAAVAGLEVDELFDGAGKDREMTGYTRKAKIFDKNAALDKAMKHHGLYEKDNDQLGTAVARIFKIPGKQRGGA